MANPTTISRAVECISLLDFILLGEGYTISGGGIPSPTPSDLGAGAEPVLKTPNYSLREAAAAANEGIPPSLWFNPPVSFQTRLAEPEDPSRMEKSARGSNFSAL